LQRIKKTMFYKSHIKLIQSLRQSKFRKQMKLFVAEGPKVVGELLNSHYTLHLLFATSEYLADLKKQISSEKLIMVKAPELDRISQLKTPNQVVGVFEIPVEPQIPKIEIEDLTLVLEDIGDPGNMGTIIRTADWFGIKEIICSENCVDIYNPKVVQSTMGSLARVKITYLDILTFFEQNISGTMSFAAVMNETSVYTLSLPKKAVLVIGSESHGISPEVLQKVDKKISIPAIEKPHGSKAESLNASVAAAILCSEFRRQNN